MKNIDVIAAILLVIGGLNWALFGLFDFDLVDYLVGQWPIVATTIYSIIGLAALWQIFQWKEIQKRW